MRRYSETQQAIAALSAPARAFFDLLPNGWMESGYRRNYIEGRLGHRGRFEEMRDELVKAGLVYHRGAGVYARTLDAIMATGGRTGV